MYARIAEKNFTMSHSCNLFGLVLAGGRSTRMGRDKSQIVYRQFPQREQMAHLLKSMCRSVVISLRKSGKQAASEELPDRFPSEGPITGILTALTTYPERRWLIVPTDMPALDIQTLQFLIRHHHAPHPITCFRLLHHQIPEPLPAVWEGYTATHLLGFYNRGGRSLHDFMRTIRAQFILPPNPNALLNINTPAEYKAFLETIKKSELTLHHPDLS